MKKPIGSQYSFSNLDGARASVDSVDRLSVSSERQEVEEVDEVEGAAPFPAASPESQKEVKEEEEEKEEENETTDPMSTLESSRNSTDPCTSEVTTEPTDENRCQRPLQRARERRAARLQKESDAHAVTNFDPHDSGSQRSSVSCDLEQDRPQLQCCGCNNILTESDLSAWDDMNQSLRRAGWSDWDAEIDGAPACAACRNHWSL